MLCFDVCINPEFASSLTSLLSVHIACISLHGLISFIYFLIHLFISAGLIWTQSLVQLGPWCFTGPVFETGDG